MLQSRCNYHSMSSTIIVDSTILFLWSRRPRTERRFPCEAHVPWKYPPTWNAIINVFCRCDQASLILRHFFDLGTLNSTLTGSRNCLFSLRSNAVRTNRRDFSGKSRISFRYNEDYHSLVIDNRATWDNTGRYRK